MILVKALMILKKRKQRLMMIMCKKQVKLQLLKVNKSMSMYIYLSFYILSIYLSVYLSIYQSISIYLGDQERLLGEIIELVDGMDEQTSKYIFEQIQNILKEEERVNNFEALKIEIIRLKGK